MGGRIRFLDRKMILLIVLVGLFAVSWLVKGEPVLTKISKGESIFSDSKSLDVAFFYGKGCPHCAKVEPLIDELEQKYSLQIHRYDIYSNRSLIAVFDKYLNKYGLPTDQTGVPTVFVANTSLTGDSPILENLEDAVKTAQQEASPAKQSAETPATTASIEAEDCDPKKTESISYLSFLAITTAALMDSVNPCSIAILVFLIGARVLVTNQKKRALNVGLSFCLAVFIGYLLFGIGLLTAVQIGGLSGIFNLLVGSFTLIVGVFCLKDVLLRNQVGFKMEVPQSLKPLLMKSLKGVTSPPGAFIMGLASTCFELPCTGGPYLFILGQLAKNSTRLNAIPPLLYYNLIFISPLITISMLLYSNMFSVNRIRDWTDKNKNILRFGEGITMIALSLIVIPPSQIVDFLLFSLSLIRTASPAMVISIILVSFLLFRHKLTLLPGRGILMLSILTLTFLISPVSRSFTNIGPSEETSQVDAAPLQKIDSSLLNKQGEITVIVDFSKKPQNYKQFIKSLGGEIVQDYGIIEGVAVKIDVKNIQKLAGIGNLKKIHVNGQKEALLHDSGPLISADKVWANGITGKDVKVCIVDSGLDYSHSAIDPGCKDQIISGTVEPKIVESIHPYTNYYDNTTTITMPSYASISVHFVNISTENVYDFVYIKDAQGNIIDTLTGKVSDRWSKSVPGNTVQINLVSDISVTDYGYYIDKVLNGTVTNGWTGCNKVIGGYDFVNNDEDPFDDYGHGTHVTGIIASNDPYSRGIANGTKLLIAKVLDYSGHGSDGNIISGIDWCVNNNAQIMSLSLGGDPYDGTCDDLPISQALNNAVDRGIAVVVAAGNKGSQGLADPACASKVIAVGSVDKSRNVVSSSSKGPELDIVAPGAFINSTFPGGWMIKSGTSMAAPHVSGTIALMLEAKPTLNVDEIKYDLYQTTDSVNKCYDNNVEIPCTVNATGAGIVNASRAVERARATHDISVTNLSRTKTVLGQGYSTSINATVMNGGSYVETFNVKVYANQTVIGTQNVTLSAGNLTMINFTWNSVGYSYGNYAISAYAEPVPGETHSEDNIFVDDSVRITIPGDTNGDKIVNVLDLILIAIHLGHTRGDGHTPFTSDWYKCMNTDIQGDGRRNVLDLIICANHLGQRALSR